MGLEGIPVYPIYRQYHNSYNDCQVNPLTVVLRWYWAWRAAVEVGKFTKSEHIFFKYQKKVSENVGYALLRPFSYLRPFLYFDPQTLLRPKLYFNLNLTSTFLAKLYFDPFTSTKTVLRPVLLDQ